MPTRKPHNMKKSRQENSTDGSNEAQAPHEALMTDSENAPETKPAKIADQTDQKASKSSESKHTLVGMPRRDFLLGVGVFAGLVCIGAIGRYDVSDSGLVRPPGAQNEEMFLSLCTRCDRCRSVCPTEVIAPCALEGGIASMRTPKMNYKLGWCNFCGKCAEVCPTGALSLSPGESFVFDGLPDYTFYETQQKLGRAQINRDHCIIWSGQSTCVVCSQSCPYDAISLDDGGRPVVDENKCTGCGVCENVCPSSRLLSYEGGSTRGIEVVSLSSARA